MSTHALHFRNKIQQATTVEDSLKALLDGISEEIEARHASPKALSELATEIHDNADVLIEDIYDNIAEPNETMVVTSEGAGRTTTIIEPPTHSLGAVAVTDDAGNSVTVKQKGKAKEKSA